MSYPKQLARIRPLRGINYDTPTHEVPHDYYTRGQNVHFRKGFPERIGGSKSVYGTLSTNIQRLLNARLGSTNWWLYWGVDSVYGKETSNNYDLTPGGGLQTITNPWEITATVLNGVPVFTNGLDTPQYWDGDAGNNFADLPNFPAGTICKSIAAYKFHLFALDIDGPAGQFEDQILWSDAAEPGAVPATWTAAAANQAGDAVLGDTPGPCLLAKPLRGQLIIYKRSAMYSVDYVGGNEVFAISPPLFSSTGALTRHSVADLNGQHFVVTDGDVILTDGTNRRSIANGRMRDALFQQLDQDYYENLYAVYHRAKNEVWLCFPESGEQYPTKAFVYDVHNDSFGERDLESGNTCAAVGLVNDAAVSDAWNDDSDAWNSDTSKWNQANYSYATESLVTAAGTTMTQHDTEDNQSPAASVGKYDMHLGDPERVKFVRRVHLRLSAGFDTVYVRVGGRMKTQDAITWETEQALTEPEDYVNVLVMGKYISVEVRSEDSAIWQLSGFDFEYERRGYF